MIESSIAAHWACAVTLSLLSVQAVRLSRRARAEAQERSRERRMREELEAYTQIDLTPAPSYGSTRDPLESSRQLARSICAVVTSKSVFRRVAILLRNPEGRLVCAASVGIDDLTLAALHQWGEHFITQERAGHPRSGSSSTQHAKSFQIQIGEWGEFDQEVGTWAQSGRRERRRWRRATVTPIRTQGGRTAGAMIVCADGSGLDGPGGWAAAPGSSLARAMGPLEVLAARLATFIENQALSERLLRAEKLAGLGQLAGGVAHALNNPLTAVLGFAELIAETASEARVQRDARTILLEAVKMKDTVGRLIEFWRPSTRADEIVDVGSILLELAAACGETLERRGVSLLMAGLETAPAVRGSRARLKQVMEHLLNNAAQAIAGGSAREHGEDPHAIRLTVSHDERAVHIIVSDTGPGFKEPGRIFDPFYTTKGPEQGAGLGLSICYGIVREHGGEISAFNLHPHGAAVVLELPLGRVLEESVMLPEQPAAFPVPSLRNA